MGVRRRLLRDPDGINDSHLQGTKGYDKPCEIPPFPAPSLKRKMSGDPDAEGNATSLEEGGVDPYVGKQVIMVHGKYKGRWAIVERKVKKKYRVQVQGVEWGLEFYSNTFAIPSAAPLCVFT